MKHTLIRTLIALCLILVLLVNVSPLRVQAMGAGGLLSGAVVSLPASWVVGGIVVGLGITVGSSSKFQGFVTSITDLLTYDGCVVDGMIDVVRFTGVNGQEATYGVPQDVVSDVFDSAYEVGAITSASVNGFKVPANKPCKFGDYGIRCSVDSICYLYRFSEDSTTAYMVLVTEDSSAVFYNAYYAEFMQPVMTRNELEVDGRLYYFTQDAVYVEKVPFDTPIYSGNPSSFLSAVINGEFDPSVFQTTVADGLGAAQIAPQGSDLAVGYPQWVANTINYKIDGQSIPYLPVGLGATYEDTIAKTQEEIWAGTSEYQMEVLGNWDLLLSLIQAIKTGIQNVVSAVRSIPEKLAAFFADVISAIEAIPGVFADVIPAIEAIPGAFAESWKTVIGLGQDILSNVTSIPIAIAQAIAGVLVDALTWAFAISDTFVATKVEALTLKYPYLETFHALGADLKGFFAGLGSRPPVIYINLGAATGSIYWGGSQPFLDLTWYAAYKPTMDAILGGFLWLAVGWRTYLHLPGLISGATGVIGAFGSYNRAAEAESKRRRDDP